MFLNISPLTDHILALFLDDMICKKNDKNDFVNKKDRINKDIIITKSET